MFGFRGSIVGVGAVCAALSLVMPHSPVRAGTVTMTYSAPGAAGTVNTFITDLNGDTVNVTTNINANWTATQKRNAILASLNAAAIPAGWAYAANGAAGINFTQNGKLSLVVNSNPRGTRELQDRLVVPGNNNGSFKGGHGTMDPHAPTMSLFSPDSTPSSFMAGVQIGSTDYAVTLHGDDAIFKGATTATGAMIATDLYNGLVGLGIPGVTLGLVSGDTNGYAGDLAITADFVPGSLDEGIIFGTDSPISDDPTYNYGFNGSLYLTAVPEPSSLIMLSLGAIGAGLASYYRRGRARKNA
jgi:hypothetical protein